MSLDERRVDWLGWKDEETGTYLIRKPCTDELKYLLQNPFLNTTTKQQLNWFRYLKGLPPFGREDYVYRFGATDQTVATLSLFYTKEGKIRNAYMYLEELYKIIREEN